MSYSISVADPNGIEIELLYELPRETWEGDVQLALNTGIRVPLE